MNAGTADRGSVQSSTRGGRSVLRAAAAVEAAALRSLALGATVPLSVFDNPLSRQLGDALDLSALDRLVGGSPDAHPVRRSGGRQAAAGSPLPGAGTASHHGGIGAAAAGAVAGAGSATPRGIGAVAAASARALQPAAGVGSSVAAARTRTASTGNAARSTAAATRASSTVSAARTAGSRANAAAQGGGTTRSADELDPTRVSAPTSTNALRQATRPGRRAGAEPDVPQAQATRAHVPTGRAPERANDPGVASGSSRQANAGGIRRSVDRTAIAPDGVSAAYPDLARAASTTQREFSGGGLAELVARWQDGEGPAAPDAPEGGPGGGSPVWTPLSSTTFDHERPLRLDDEDRIEVALEQILRREVERHGLEGGR